MPEDKFLSRSFKTFLADKLKKKGFKAASPENLSARQVLGVPNLSSGNLEPQFSICQTSFLSSRKLRVWTYSGLTKENAELWLQSLRNAAAPPSVEQEKFLETVVRRCLIEAQEERDEPEFRSEPVRTFLHGVPGAGKSQTLKWLRDFFETVCGWQHEQQFVYVAPQNTQAALVRA